MLTAKQERFVQNLVKGMSQREAYKEAYAPPRMKDDAIDVKACQLFAQDKVKIRYQQLLDELADKSIMTAKERLVYLTDIIKSNEEADMNAKLKAIDIMNKMQGEYVQKIDANVNQDVNISIELSDE